MPDRVFTVPALGEPHQTTIAAASSGSASAGNLVLVVPNNMTNADVRRGLASLVSKARMDPNQVTGI
jgi:hypothetical protein